MAIPDWLLQVLGWTLGAGAATSAVLWALVWLVVLQSTRAVPTLRLGQRLAEADPPTGRVCVVIPAHNESRTIAGLVRSLRAETYPQFDVVLALDRCTDDTAAVARAEIAGDPRFEIVEIGACPDDWAGKVHAAHSGVTRGRAAAHAGHLLFADADTVFSPGCIAASLAMMRQRELDFLSLLSTLIYDKWFTCVVQTAAALELMRQYPLARANARTDRRAFANGQFMLFTRDAYDAVGGHAAVKAALLEDIALARLIESHRRNAGVFLAAGLFHCRMYEDWPRFRQGWKRIYTEAANRKSRRLSVSALRIRCLGTVFPLWMLGCGMVGAIVVARDARMGWTLVALALVATTCWLGALMRVSSLAGAPAWTAPLHIVGAWLTGGVLSEAARDLRSRRPVSWGGREYDLGADQAATGRPAGERRPTSGSRTPK
ncbi:MAG: glycosyltransferase family 2 protein [Betaproteobacteria bacterium]